MGSTRTLLAIGVAVALVSGACGSSSDETVAELQTRIEELEASTSVPSTTTTTVPTTTTTAATTTTSETLGEAAGVWCELNPWAFIQVGLGLGLVSGEVAREAELAGVSEFWFSDGMNRLTGEQKFDSLPNDWYEYPGAVAALVEVLWTFQSQSEENAMSEEDFAHVCNTAYETR